MKLKILLISMTILCSFATVSMAQNIGNGVVITEPKVSTAEGQVRLSMEIDAAEPMDIRCNGSYRLVPYIAKGETRLQLPEVVYAGNERYMYDVRNEMLSREYVPEPYKVYRKANKRAPGKLTYEITVPYYVWMDGAQVTYEWQAFGCGGDVIADRGTLSQEVAPEVRQWTPQQDLFAAMVTYYKADPEEYFDRRTLTMKRGKRRDARLSLNIVFPQDDPVIHTDFAGNAAELGRADSLLNYIMGNSLALVSQINITGNASPEGALWRNTNLARYRANNFVTYLKERHDIASLPVSVKSVPVDWEGLMDMVVVSDLPFRDDILYVIEENKNDSEKCDRMLQRIDNGRPYKKMLDEMYPKLRRTELHAEFIVASMTAEQAKDLIYTNPEMLSLDEMYGVAETMKPGSDEYVDVFMIAARQFPNDFIANNNAAAALLERGDAEGAYRYVVKIAHDPRGYMNVSAYYYLMGDVEHAKKYLNMAVGENIPGAQEQLDKLVK